MVASLRRVWRIAFVLVLLGVPTAAWAQPPAVSGGIATGELSGERPTFSWGAVPTTTWYLLWITDSTGVKVQTWYPAARLGCDIRPLCSITLDLSLQPGEITWWVQTYGVQGPGPWSDPQRTTMRDGGEQGLGVYDSAGTRFATVLSFDASNRALIRLQIGAHVLPFFIQRTGVRGVSDDSVYYTGSGCTGEPMLRHDPQSLMPPVAVTQPEPLVWMPREGAQVETRLIQTVKRPSGACDTHSGNVDGYDATIVGQFPHTGPFSVR